jgi:hypothetical protein
MGRNLKAGEKTQAEQCAVAIENSQHFKPAKGECTDRADWAVKNGSRWEVKRGSPFSQFSSQTVLCQLRKKFVGKTFKDRDGKEFKVTFMPKPRRFCNLACGQQAKVSMTT